MTLKKLVRRIVFIFISLWSISIFASQVVVNVSVANMYKKANNNSPLVSQVIYNSPVKLLKQKGDYYYIEAPDGYHGWVSGGDLIENHGYRSNQIAEVTNLFCKIYRVMDTTTHPPVLSVPFSTRLPILKRVGDRWVKVQLANGHAGWLHAGDIAINPKPLTLQQMLVLSKRFIGLPYEWGGTTTYGFDCSSFVQMLYKQMGVAIPRDANDQATSPLFIKASRNSLQPGDLLYFGWDNVISHAGLYIGDGKFVSITAHTDPVVQIANINYPYWSKIFITARRLKTAYKAPEFSTNISPIPPKVLPLIKRYTWHKGCPVPTSKLAYVRLIYWGFDERAHKGVLIVDKYLAPEVVAMFKELYNERFAIKSMRPMYLYKGDDNAAMVANNSSAFNCRHKTDYPKEYSIHSYGGAIDINPLINPYVNGNKVLPAGGRKYLDRNDYSKGKIMADSDIVKIFTAHGWVWGGNWPDTIRDYQHFQKPFS